MSDEFPREAAFDSRGNPLFMSDGNLASAADAAQFPNERLYVHGDDHYTGDIYDGWGNKVSRDGRGYQPDWGGGSYDPGNVIGGVVFWAFVGFLLLISGPIDKWLMGMAQNQTSRSSELETEIEAVQGINFGAFFAGLLFWVWPLFFLRIPFSVVIAFLTFFWIPIIPCLIPVMFIVWVLVIIRGNEWAWYSGKWATPDDFRKAKKRWVNFLIVFYIFALVVAGCGALLSDYMPEIAP